MWNIKPREVYCENCKITIVTDKPSPTCETCGKRMLTVVKSALTGEKLTSVVSQ